MTLTPTLIPLQLSQIQTLAWLQVRSPKMLSLAEREATEEELKKQHDRLVSVIEAGEPLEHIKVIRHGQTHAVFDGHHRLRAYEAVFKPDDTIEVELLPYTYKEALAKGYTVNVTHGSGLKQGERTHTCFRSLMYASDDITVKTLMASGIGERLAQKIKQAATLFRKELDIDTFTSETEVHKKVAAWVRAEEKKTPQGFLKDEQGFPSYRYVLDRKPTSAEPSEAVRVARMVEKLKGLVEADPMVFRKAVKKLSAAYTLNIQVGNIKEPKYDDI